MATQEQLRTALTDVRTAFRLVQGWQRRVNDLLMQVEAVVEPRGLGFDRWRPARFAAPKQSTTPFYRHGTWAWDMLPGYDVAVAWVDSATRYSSDGRLRRVVVRVVADTGFAKPVTDGPKREPWPEDLCPAEDARSVVRIALWTGAAVKPWWDGAWDRIRVRPDCDERPQEVSIDGIAFSRELVEVPTEQLLGPDDVQRWVLRPVEEWLDTV